MHGLRPGVILTTMSHEEHAMLCDTTWQANECVVFDTQAHRDVRDHLRQDQLSATRRTMHHSQAY